MWGDWGGGEDVGGSLLPGGGLEGDDGEVFVCEPGAGNAQDVFGCDGFNAFEVVIAELGVAGGEPAVAEGCGSS